MEKISSLESYQQYCDGKEPLTNTQLLFQKDYISKTTLYVVKKNILTPYAMSCNITFEFSIDIEIINGANHLDYRYQYTMIFIIAFIIFLAISIIISLLVVFIGKTSFQKFLPILIFNFLSICQVVPLYFEFIANENNEFITEKWTYELIYYILSSFNLINLFILNAVNDSSLYLCKVFKVSWPMYILTSINIVLLIIILIINLTNFNHTKFFITTIFYFIIMLASGFSPNLLTLTKIGILVFIICNFFTFATKPSILFFADKISSKGIAIMSLDIVGLICTLITLILLLLDYFYFNSKFMDVNRIDNVESEEFSKNYTNMDQDGDFLTNVQSNINMVTI